MPPPETAEARAAILRVLTQKTPLAADVDLAGIAQRTPGCGTVAPVKSLSLRHDVSDAMSVELSQQRGASGGRLNLDMAGWLMHGQLLASVWCACSGMCSLCRGTEK